MDAINENLMIHEILKILKINEQKTAELYKKIEEIKIQNNLLSEQLIELKSNMSYLFLMSNDKKS